MIIQFVSKLSKGPALDKLTFSLKGLDVCPGCLTSSGNGIRLAFPSSTWAVSNIPP